MPAIFVGAALAATVARKRAPTAAFQAAVISTMLLALTVHAAEPKIDEWKVPWSDTRPRDPYTVDGNTVWFCGQTGHYLARFQRDSGDFKRFALLDQPGPHNLVIDDEGAVWFAGNLRGYIGRLDPASGEIERIAMPDPAAADPHTLTFDEHGSIWFTVQGGNFIGRLTRANRNVQLVPVATRLARPYGIEIAPDGRAWVVLFGTNRLAMVDPATMQLSEIELPRKEARPRRVGITGDGRIWYGDHAAGMLGVYDPATKLFQEWPLPDGADSRPYAMAVDDRDRIWVVETGVTPNRFVAFDASAGNFVATVPVPSGGGSVRHMQFHAPSRAIWFGADTNTIGRLVLGE